MSMRLAFFTRLTPGAVDTQAVRKSWLRIVCLVGLCVCAAYGNPIRVKDLGKLKGWRDNALVGYGIVTGLAGTGDNPSSAATRQAMSNVLSQFNLSIPADQIQSRNVGIVMLIMNVVGNHLILRAFCRVFPSTSA